MARLGKELEQEKAVLMEAKDAEIKQTELLRLAVVELERDTKPKVQLEKELAETSKELAETMAWNSGEETRLTARAEGVLARQEVMAELDRRLRDEQDRVDAERARLERLRTDSEHKLAAGSLYIQQHEAALKVG